MYVGHGGIAVSLTIGSSLSLPDVDNKSFTEVLPLWLTSWRERASGLSASESSMNLKELTLWRIRAPRERAETRRAGNRHERAQCVNMKCTEQTYRGRVVHIHSVTLHSVVVVVVAVSGDPVLVVFVALSPCGLPHEASRTRQASGVAVQDPDHLRSALRARWNRAETRKPLVLFTRAGLEL